jgi:hypothetical protein
MSSVDMFVKLGEVEDRSWLVPSCSVCPRTPRVQRKPTYEDLRESGEKSCEKCRLFTQSIVTICPPEARLSTVKWTWNYSVLNGRGRDHSGEGEDEVSTEFVYEIEFSIHPGTLD